MELTTFVSTLDSTKSEQILLYIHSLVHHKQYEFLIILLWQESQYKAAYYKLLFLKWN